MSAVVSEMLIRIAADTAQLRSQMQQAESAVGGSLDSIKGAATNLKNTLVGLFAGIGVAMVAKQFIETADAMAQLDARMKNAVGSGEDFARAQADIYRISQANNIGLQEAATLYTKLHDPVKRLGGTTHETAGIVEAFALSLRLGGASTQEASAATLQFAQAMGSGKLQGDEFRSMAEASPRFMKALAEGMGVPIEKLKEMGSEGKLTADVVGNALTQALGQLKSEAGNLPDTVSGAFQRIKNDVTVMVAELNENSGLTIGLAEMLELLRTEVLPVVKDELAAAFQAVGAWIERNRDGLGEVWENVKAVAGGAWDAVKAIASVLAPIGEWIVQSGLLKTVFESIRLIIAGITDGVNLIGAAMKYIIGDTEGAKKVFQAFADGKTAVGALNAELAQNATEQKKVTLVAVDSRAEFERQDQTFKTLKNSTTELSKEQQKAIDDYKKLTNSIKDKTKTMLAEDEAGGKLTDGQKAALKVMLDLQNGTLKLTDAQKRELTGLLELNIETENNLKAKKDLQEAQRKVAEHSSKLTEAEWKEVDALRESNVTLIKQNETLRDGEEAVRKREVAVLRSRATDLEWMAATLGGNAALEEQARLLRQRADLVEDNAGLQAAKKVKEEWAETAKNIETSLTDALMRGFESGKGFFENLREVAVNMFKTLVLRPIIQPIAQGMAGTVLSAFGMNASASTGAAGGGMSLSGLVSGGMNFLNGSMITNMATSGISNLGASIGGDFGANLMMNSGTYGSYLGMAGNAFAGYGLGRMANGAISGGYQISSGMSTFQDIGSAVAGALAGPLGGLIAGAVSGLVNRAFGRRLADQGIEGTFGGGGFEGQNYQFYRGGWFRSDRTVNSDLDPEMGGALAAGAHAIYAQVQHYAEVLKLPADELANVTSYMRISLGDDAEENQQAIADAMAAYGDALVASFSDVLIPFQREGERLIETLQRLSILETFSQSINELGGIFSSIAGSSIEARESLIGMAGGIDALIGKAASFVQNYYSADEQAGMQARSIQQALASAGLTAEDFARAGIDPSQIITREEFRALVESRDVETELGREQLMTLLNVSESFAGLSDYMEESGRTFEELVAAAPQVAILSQMLDPTQVTADATTSMANSLEQSNATLTAIEARLDSISVASEAAAAAASAAASAASSAASAASSAASSASLRASAPTYDYNIGGA